MLQKLKNLPAQPGIYQYFDEKRRLLYIGKAKNLSNRVKSYFSFTPTLGPSAKLSPRIHQMILQVASMHYIVVDSEHDALILENSLIKQLKPKYNILLRDDKTYPYIYIDTAETFPRFDITRKVLKSKTIKYFGPFSIGARDILDAVYELCQLVQKKSCLKAGKACLFYQIEKCLAPCEGKITPDEYQKIVAEAMHLIHNKKELINRLSKKMHFYAEALRFEEAKNIRDAIDRIAKSEIKSHIDFANLDNFDVFAIGADTSRGAIVRMFMREGRIVSSSHDFFTIQSGFDKDEAFLRTIMNFYTDQKPPIVAPILVSDTFEGSELLQEHLSNVFGKKATITNPSRGNKKRLVELAKKNVDELLSQPQQHHHLTNLKALQELCQLASFPQRIEVFDNSHISGQARVGAMISYDNGEFDKSGYRTYHLESRDEYGQMRETLTRRMESFEKNPPPDLWVLDGGTTLLSLAQQLLESHGVNLEVIAISKEKIDAKSHRAKGKAKDIIHTVNESFSLQESDKRLQFVQLLRDEAHRRAIGFHKKTKLKLDQESKLLNLKGISPAKIKKLLLHFETFSKLTKVSEEEIASLLNKSDAKIIKKIYK